MKVVKGNLVKIPSAWVASLVPQKKETKKGDRVFVEVTTGVEARCNDIVVSLDPDAEVTEGETFSEIVLFRDGVKIHKRPAGPRFNPTSVKYTFRIQLREGERKVWGLMLAAMPGNQPSQVNAIFEELQQRLAPQEQTADDEQGNIPAG